MKLEREILIGKNTQSVGLDFGFGCLLNMEKKFGYSATQLVELSQRLAIVANYAQAIRDDPTSNITKPEVEVSESEMYNFMSAIVKSAHYSYCELNDETIVLTNDTKAYTALADFGFEVISEMFFTSYFSISQNILKGRIDTDSKKKGKK